MPDKYKIKIRVKQSETADNRGGFVATWGKQKAAQGCFNDRVLFN